MIKVSEYLPTGDAALQARKAALTKQVAAMAGSRILSAATEAKELKAKGVDICDLTVGDYAPEHFQAPASFLEDLVTEIEAGRNQYPPSDGMPELQRAIQEFYSRELEIEFPDKTVVVCGGARPPIYAIFRCLVGEKDKVLFFTPSWNNDYYAALCGVLVPVPTTAENNFFPTAADVSTGIADPGVRLVCLCSPLNPCGTVIGEDVLRGICEAILAENTHRLACGIPPVHLMFDMVYWPLTFGGAKFHHPLELVPEIARWTIYVDAISKWMVSTGLRLGWAVVPQHLYAPVRDFMGHVGGWAPRPVQVAAAKFLQDGDRFHEFRDELRAKLEERLGMVHTFFVDMEAVGLPVKSISPQGAIYISVQFNVMGQTTPGGRELLTNNDIRQYILNEARVALVAFQAFSMLEETGWFRISVGAVGTEALECGLHRIRDAVSRLR